MNIENIIKTSEDRVRNQYDKLKEDNVVCKQIEFSIYIGNYCNLDNKSCYNFSLKQNCDLRYKHQTRFRNDSLRKDNYMFVKNRGNE